MGVWVGERGVGVRRVGGEWRWVWLGECRLAGG